MKKTLKIMIIKVKIVNNIIIMQVNKYKKKIILQER